ncbi:WYL domain-containing protein [Niveibacterium sp. 24ML]|uniref:helix-turn-helix transcriptional regulator n=1 Tax=Niveibacterium sp. 24ML TaxID=2985512 RepID=UPI00226EDDE5|nr:WYL domain-containing protein [Niveibacterium sp. 24ML]MCX9157792.1 WYL domain-containing protein [Niveibacterium sp. 24ML]
MDRTERFYKIDRLIAERRVVSRDELLAELEVSLATLKRDLEYLRSRLEAPIVWDRDAGGYRYETDARTPSFELPGMWFSAAEIHALLSMEALLECLGPGLLTPHVQPLLTRLRAMLDREDIPLEVVNKRIRVMRLSGRRYEPRHFTPIAHAVLKRQRLVIDHRHRGRNELTRREVSPQRLTYYRENWYLEAWCHLRDELRSFGLDAIEGVWSSTEAAKDVSERQLKAVLDAGYGIFSGEKVEWAELRFAPERARWVSKETWHPDQQGAFDDAGYYTLRIPYSAPFELAMDVMRHLPEVEVIGPDSLRDEVKTRLAKSLEAMLALKR